VHVAEVVEVSVDLGACPLAVSCVRRVTSREGQAAERRAKGGQVRKQSDAPHSRQVRKQSDAPHSTSVVLEVLEVAVGIRADVLPAVAGAPRSARKQQTAPQRRRIGAVQVLSMMTRI
jgi:hypothetical protein